MMKIFHRLTAKSSRGNEVLLEAIKKQEGDWRLYMKLY